MAIYNILLDYEILLNAMSVIIAFTVQISVERFYNF